MLCPTCGQAAPDDARFCPYCAAPLAGPLAPDPGGESRRPVSIVFTDVVESTALGERIEPETLRQVMARYFEEMRVVVTRHGGTVEKFIGDADMAVFGIPRVHEDDALRAVRAADEMRRALADLNERLVTEWGVRIEVRCGVNTGEVVVGTMGQGSFVTGSPVNLAARLEQAAEPGQILVGPDTFRLVRDAIEAEAGAPLTMKGFEDPIVPMVLTSVIEGQPKASGAHGPLVGRAEELSLISQVCHRALEARRCQLVTIMGDPGVGKTRLAEEVVAKLGEPPLVLRGRCLPYGEGITFYPIAEAVGQATGLKAGAEPEEARRTLEGLIGPDPDGIAGILAEAIGLSGATPAPEQTLWAIRRFFEILAATRPLVLVFDDLQWAEPTFLDLLDSVSHRARDVGIVLLCTARPELLERRPEWGGGTMHALTTLLEPLSMLESATMAGNLVGGALDPSVSGRLAEAGGGNPLFLQEYVAMLLEQGSLLEGDHGWALTSDPTAMSTPPTLAALLAARLDRLPDDERSVLLHASVIGKVFSVGELQALVPASLSASIAACLTRLCDRELLRPVQTAEPGGEPYEFIHLLVRDSAYETLPKAARADLHERFADWIEASLGPRAEEYQEIVGYHLSQAHRYLRELGSHDPNLEAIARRAAGSLHDAGRRAAGRGDAPAAERLLARAAELAPDAHTRAESRLLMLDALIDAGATGRTPAVLRAARDDVELTDDEGLRARLSLMDANLRFLTQPDTITLDELSETAHRAGETLGALGDDRSLAGALNTEALVAWLAGDARQMLEAAERALDVATRAGNRREAAQAAIYLFLALERGDTPYPDALVRVRALQASVASDRVTAAVSHSRQADLLGTLGRFEEAKAETDLAIASFSDLGQERWLATATVVAGHVAEMQGHLEEAASSFQEGHAFFDREGDVANASVVACDLARVLNRLGRHEEAGRTARAAGDAAAAYDLEVQVAWRTEAARASAASGYIVLAEELANEAVERASRTDFSGLRADALAGRADVWARGGRLEDAVEAWREVQRLREAKVDVVGAALAADVLSTLTRTDERP
ncbi:MAG TPA: adenylate/guanylate cyclase domain-containing protein [Actinomycetota bacterium]